MLPGDLALIEVNTDRDSVKSKSSSDFVVSQKNLRHNFSPLAVLGYEYIESKFQFNGRKKLSSCPNAVSIETSYELPDGRSTPVAINHRYEFDSFCSWIEGKLESTAIWKREENKVGLVLLLRPPVA